MKQSTKSDLPKLAAPARRALANERIDTLEQVAQRTEAELRHLHGMGPNAMRVLTDALTAKGLQLRK